MKRKWIDLFLFYSTVMIIVSGIVLYIMPHGRVAYFTGWTFLGLGKDAWDNLHVVFGILMVIVAVWHIVVNWKVLKKYLIAKESLFSLLIVVFIIFGTVNNLQPFKAVSDFEEYVKSLWPQNKYQIPIAHGELLTLNDFCKKLGINETEALKTLKMNGISAELDETLKEIAQKNNKTPVEIYQMIKNSKKEQTVKQTFMPGSGIGRMSLEEFCKKYHIDINKAMNNLKEKGIKADKKMTLREIAFKNNLTPIDIAEIITGNE